MSDDPIGATGDRHDESSPEKSSEGRNRTSLPEPCDIRDRDDVRRASPERRRERHAVENVTGAAIRDCPEQRGLGDRPSSSAPEKSVHDQLDASCPVLRKEQVAAHLVYEDRHAQVGTRVEDRRVEAADIRLDAAHVRLEEDGIDAEMAEVR